MGVQGKSSGTHEEITCGNTTLNFILYYISNITWVSRKCKYESQAWLIDPIKHLHLTCWSGQWFHEMLNLWPSDRNSLMQGLHSEYSFQVLFIMSSDLIWLTGHDFCMNTGEFKQTDKIYKGDLWLYEGINTSLCKRHHYIVFRMNLLVSAVNADDKLLWEHACMVRSQHWTNGPQMNMNRLDPIYNDLVTSFFWHGHWMTFQQDSTWWLLALQFKFSDQVCIPCYNPYLYEFPIKKSYSSYGSILIIIFKD